MSPLSVNGKLIVLVIELIAVATSSNEIDTVASMICDYARAIWVNTCRLDQSFVPQQIRAPIRVNTHAKLLSSQCSHATQCLLP